MNFTDIDITLLKISPLWAIVLSIITGLIVKFWGVFKSTFELKIKGRQDLEGKKTDHKLLSEAENIKDVREFLMKELERVHDENKQLKHDNEIMKDQIMKLTQAVTYLSSGLDMMIDEFGESNPMRVTMINKLRELSSSVMKNNENTT